MVKLLKIVKSDKPLKKWTAIFKLDNDKEKKVNFGYYNKDQEIGISAQEVQSVLPEIVKLAPFDSARNINNELISKSGSNYLTVDYEKLAPLFIEAIKELTNKINKMDKEFKEYILEKEST